MSKLSELNKTIIALNDLWPLLEGEEKESVLGIRNNLNEMASALAHKTLLEGVPELDDATNQLNLVTRAAKDAKDSIDDVSARINKVADTIEKATAAAGKVADLIAVL